jgi:hypothetical protein
MGNEPSIATLPESWHTILPIITRESILEYSYHHRHRRSTLSSSRSSSTSSSNSRDIINSRSSNSIDNGGKNDKDGEGGDTDADVNVTGQQKSVYLDDDLFDLDEHVPIALAILTAYPHLKDIRFKLVPGVLKEERYWECIFGILDNHGAGDGGGGEIRGVGVENISEAQDEYYCELEKEAGMISTSLNAQTSSCKSNPLGKLGEKLSVKTPILNLGAYTVV